jgi:hypothetical protein
MKKHPTRQPHYSLHAVLVAIGLKLRAIDLLQLLEGVRIEMLLLDIDLTCLPCGKKSEDAAKGYQAEAGIRWGRQLV